MNGTSMENDQKINRKWLGNERTMIRKLPEHDQKMNGKWPENLSDTCDTLGDTRDRVYINECLQPYQTDISHGPRYLKSFFLKSWILQWRSPVLTLGGFRKTNFLLGELNKYWFHWNETFRKGTSSFLFATFYSFSNFDFTNSRK